MKLARFFRRSHSMVLAIVATIGAAALVLYFQFRTVTSLESQTQVIARHISEQAAADIAGELQRAIAGPVLDTLTAVSHPDLRAGRLDLVAQQYERGLQAYPHVDRFLAWSTGTESATPGEALFFGRDGGFKRDSELGRAVVDLARRHAAAQHIYVAAEGIGPDRDAQVLLRVFWTDAQRRDYFALLGLVVLPSAMAPRLFADPTRARVEGLLSRRGGEMPLRLRVTDETGTFVYGTASTDIVSSRVAFPMLFYPANVIQARMAGGAVPRPWTIEVGVPEFAGTMAGVGQNYWPTLVSVALMFVALGLTLQAQRRSSDLADMQTDFVAHVSHQLKTPLSLLSAATETLQMDRIRSPEKLAAYLDTIHAEAARLSTLVQRVLEFSRVQQGRSYEFEHVDFSALTRETVTAFALGLSGQHFRFDVQAEGEGPYVLADPAALEQVLANLLDNAVKYSGANKTIIIRVSTDPKQAVVEIVDRGMGIAPADLPRVFERFYRAPNAAHRPGFGLGLPIVRELVHAHGGRVEVTSAPGVGSTFRVSLPLVTPATAAAHARSVESPEAAS